MKKKYFEIGEEFQFGFKRLKCVECLGCKGCALDDLEINCVPFIGCCSSFRNDKTSVIFIEVENNKNECDENKND